MIWFNVPSQPLPIHRHLNRDMRIFNIRVPSNARSDCTVVSGVPANITYRSEKLEYTCYHGGCEKQGKGGGERDEEEPDKTYVTSVDADFSD